MGTERGAIGRRARSTCLAFTIVWCALSLVIFVPRYRDGLLSNAWPLADAYASFLAGDAVHTANLLTWVALHTLCTLLVTAALVVVRSRLTRSRWLATMALCSGCGVGLVGWTVHECWPDGVFFDAGTVYYDVGEMVRSDPARTAGLTSADALAEHVFATGVDDQLPDYIGTISGTTTVIAWGFWPEHRRLRKALEAYRDAPR